MFGIGKNRGLRLDPDKLAQLTDEQLYLLFSEDNWAKIDKSSRLAALQEVENRRAKLDGRKPIPVLEGKSESFIKKPGLMGGFSPSQKVIYINYRFLEGNSAHHSPANALDTVIHEGRHAYQDDVINNNPDRVVRQILDEWRSSEAKYFRGCSDETAPREVYLREAAIYMMQSIEIDARRAARQELYWAAEAMEAQGVDTRDIISQIDRNLSEEINFLMLVQNYLTDSMIDELEQEVLKAMREKYPGEDFSKLRLFDHARLILRAPKITDYDAKAVSIVRILDFYEQNKLKGIDLGNFDKFVEQQLQAINDEEPDKLPDSAQEKIVANRIQSSL